MSYGNENDRKDSMRQGGAGNRRPRGRHHGGNGGNGGGNSPSSQMNPNRPRSVASLRHQTFDSNGPDVRVRGNAWQVYEKYQQLARDATASGDRVMAENYQQHAEHYYRIIEAINEASVAEQRHVTAAFSAQQPDVPPNYFTPDGKLDVQQKDAATQPPAQPEQAEVQKRVAKPSPFFTADETEETSSGPEPLVARG